MQLMHLFMPVTFANKPAEHTVQSPELTNENFPLGQSVQTVSPVTFATPPAYLPPGQSVHTDTPVLSEYLPIGQFKQVSAPSELINLPIGQLVQNV
jgi:hypothetical protein